MVRFQDAIETTKAEPRVYQERVVTKVVDYCLDGVSTILVNSPTGSGKTVMGLAAARMLQMADPNLGIGWCAMRRNLLTQVKNANRDLQMGVEGLTPISMFDRNPPSMDPHGRKLDILVVDEAQHDAAASMARMHNILRPKCVVGLSATPYRTDKLKLCFQKVIKDAGIHQLIQQGFLSPYRQYTIPRYDVDTVTKHYLNEPERWGKSAMYWRTYEDAQACTYRLRAAGVRAEMILGTQRMDEREDRLARFEKTVYGDGDKKGVDVLVNLFVLTEGWDCPPLRTCWIRDSSKGCTIQMAGRVFRKFPGITHKQVVQSKDTRYPIQRTATPTESFIWMDGEWRSVKPSNITKKVGGRVIRALVRSKTHMPDFIESRRQAVARVASPFVVDD